MHHELPRESSIQPLPEVKRFYDERLPEEENKARERFGRALHRKKDLDKGLRDRGFRLDGLELQHEASFELELPPLPEMVRKLQGWYGNDLAKQALRAPETKTEFDLQETTFTGFHKKHEQMRGHLEAFTQDVLPRAWGDGLHEIQLVASTPRHIASSAHARPKGEWTGLVKPSREGQLALVLPESLSEEEARALCLSMLPECLALQALPRVHANQDDKTRIADFYLVSHAVERGLAKDFLSSPAPSDAQHRLQTARAYESALLAYAWSQGHGAKWGDALQASLVEDRGVSPMRAAFHTALAKRLLPNHLDQSAPVAFSQRQEWMDTWQQAQTKTALERALQDVPDETIRVLLFDACLHSDSFESKPLAHWQATPELPVELVPALESGFSFVSGLRRNVDLERPLLEGIGRDLEEWRQAWHKVTTSDKPRLLRETRQLIRHIFT